MSSRLDEPHLGRAQFRSTVAPTSRRTTTSQRHNHSLQREVMALTVCAGAAGARRHQRWGMLAKARSAAMGRATRSCVQSRSARPPDSPASFCRNLRGKSTIVYRRILCGHASAPGTLRHRARFGTGHASAPGTLRRRARSAAEHSSAGRPRRARACLCARSQAVSPRATTLSASRSLSPYMKWLAMFSENRLASVVSPTASATSRMCMGVAPQQTPM